MLAKRSKAKNWIVCDANFGLLKRDVELAKAIRKLRMSMVPLISVIFG